jgi:hypothetical protein
MSLLEAEQARLAALRDPASPESQRARQTFARVAPAMADRITDEMSAADIQELMKPGFKSQLRQQEIELQNAGKAEVARIKAAAKRRGGGGGGGGGSAAEAEARAQWLQKQYGLDPQQAMFVAEDAPGFRQFATGRVERRTTKELNKEIQTLNKTLDGVATVERAMDSLDSTIEDAVGVPLSKIQFDQNGNPVAPDGKEVDLPGVNIPGFGRVDVYSPEARAMASSMQRVLNITIKDRSGAAVTTPEMERIKKEFAQGRLNTEADMIRSMKTYQQELAKARAMVESGFSKEVVEERQRRMQGRAVGSAASSPPAPASAAPAARGSARKARAGVVQVVDVSSGEVFELDASEAQPYRDSADFEVSE